MDDLIASIDDPTRRGPQRVSFADEVKRPERTKPSDRLIVRKQFGERLVRAKEFQTIKRQPTKQARSGCVIDKDPSRRVASKVFNRFGPDPVPEFG